jgi:ribose 5-phosphate isomerase A
MTNDPIELEHIARRALEFIAPNSVIGLGTGHAATAFLHALSDRVRQGLEVSGIPTSQASAELARQLGIPLTTLDDVERIDVDVDGADEVDPHLNLIKGYGGALVREKIVAAASRRVVILAGADKLVPVLGTRGIVPVEVVAFGQAECRRRLWALGCDSTPRMHEGRLFVTDNGNNILDCRVGPLQQPAELDRVLRDVPGVVGTGLFLGMAHVVLIGRGQSVEVRERAAS